MSDEIELKLMLSSEGPQRLLVHPLLSGLDTRSITLGNLYYDTPEGALESARVALRVRRMGERRLQTLKSAAQSHGGLSSRGEWEWSIDDAERSAAGLDLNGLRALHHPALEALDLERLRPVFATDFERRLWRFREGGVDIEIALDQGEIRAGAARLPICELELELKSGHPEALWDLAERLCGGQPPLPARPANHSKASRANALRRGWPHPEPPPTIALDDVIDAVDQWQDSQDAAWHRAAMSRLEHLTATSPSLRDAGQRLLATLREGRIPWDARAWSTLQGPADYPRNHAQPQG